MAKGGTRYQKEAGEGLDTRIKITQRGLYFRSWYVDRPVTVLASADPSVERTALSLGSGLSTPEGGIGLALNVPDENAFFRLIGSVDLRMAAMIIGGAIDVSALLSAFPHRRVRSFKHARRFPYGLELCDDHEAEVAVVGELELPTWPRIGLAMPVFENTAGARRTVTRLLATYPGCLDVAIVANGSSDESLYELLALEGEFCHRLSVVREPKNLGFAGGVNAGLQELWTSGWYDLFGTLHDDVVPSLNAISELADAFETLRSLGQRPGVMGPGTNRGDGPQQISLEAYRTADELDERSADQFSLKRRTADETERVGSHLMLIDAETLSDVGGFDTMFGRGFFSDDDWCLRARLAGYRIWVAPGAYVHHECGVTFNKLAADQETTLERNQSLFSEKWRMGGSLNSAKSIFAPLSRSHSCTEFEAIIHGESVDLVHQASAIEFAAFVTQRLETLPRSARVDVLKALRDASLIKHPRS